MLLSLAGCETDTPTESSKNNTFASADGSVGHVTIFRESHFVGILVPVEIKVNGKSFGNLYNGSAVRIAVPTGQIKVELSNGWPFKSSFVPISVEMSKEYYLEVAAQANPGVVAMGGAAGYLLGSLNSNVNQFCESGWCAAIEDAETANAKLKDLHVRDR
jgi:hypothetical protein